MLSVPVVVGVLDQAVQLLEGADLHPEGGAPARLALDGHLSVLIEGVVEDHLVLLQLLLAVQLALHLPGSLGQLAPLLGEHVAHVEVYIQRRHCTESVDLDLFRGLNNRDPTVHYALVLGDRRTCSGAGATAGRSTLPEGWRGWRDFEGWCREAGLPKGWTGCRRGSRC